MDKYEFNIKVEQIKKLVGKSDYETAMKIADTIDWRRVRNTNLLSMVAMVYEKNEDYEEAKEILLLAFERAPIGKRLLYKLAELALKEGNIDEAEAYYREFSDLAGDDPRQQLLRYMILKAKGAPAQQLIHSLESYTSQEIDEKWLYELAELYSLAGLADRCVETCDKIMLLFGLGKYVDKAMELKIQYAPLTTYQMDLVENRDKYEEKLRAVEQEYGIGGGRINDPEQEEEYYDDDNQEMYMPEESDPAVRMQEAEVQEGLAREMSRMTYEEPPAASFPARPDKTRILDDIKRINRPVMQERIHAEAVMAAGEAAAAGSEAEMAGAVFSEAGTGEAGAVLSESASKTACEEPDIEAQAVGNTERQISAMPCLRAAMKMPEEYPSEPVVEEDYAYGDEPARQMGAASGNAYDQENGEYDEADNTYAYNGGYDYDKREAEYDDLKAVQTEGIPESGEADCFKIENPAEEEPAIFNHLMIEARTPEKGLKIAVEALKQIHKEAGRKNPVAKITGEKLSRRGILASAEKLAGKDLIIEEAGDLSKKALGELDELINRDTSGMIVVMIDNPKQIENLYRNYPRLAGKFECMGREEGDASEGGYAPAAVQEHEPEKAEVSPPGAMVSPLYPRRNKAPVGKQPAHGVSQDARKSYRKWEQDDRPYGAEPYIEDSAAEETYETDSHDNQSFGGGDEEKPRKKKKGMFRSRQKPVYEELKSEESYENDDRYAEEAEGSASYCPDDRPGIHGEEMDIDEFAQYACGYANEIDCSITGKSMLALYERIEIMEEDGVSLTRESAKRLIEEAADRSEKPSFGKRVKGIFSSKYDKDGLLVLKEEHFIY